MNFNQNFVLKTTPSAWFWLGVFISISGIFYLWWYPDFIANLGGYLSGFNIVMSLIAAYYIYGNITYLKRSVQGDIIGSKFTWAFIKIVPILVIVPVLSFYLFSFQSIQSNVRESERVFNTFNKDFIQKVNILYNGVETVIEQRYTDQTKQLLAVISSFIATQQDSKDYKQSVQNFLDVLVDKDWACQITLSDSDKTPIAETDPNRCNALMRQSLSGTQTHTINIENAENAIQVEMARRNPLNQDLLRINATHVIDPRMNRFLLQARTFVSEMQNIEFDINTDITETRFIIYISFIALFATLIALLVVLSMIERLMKPLNYLSMATKEIAKGNYDVRISKQKESQDVGRLIEQFNTMSRQIKSSREGLDTHNLYLETILKYSYGVIGLDKARNIQLINPMIGKMLAIDEHQFIGGLCEEIPQNYPYLEPLFSMIAEKFSQNHTEWSAEIELSLPKRSVLLTCQGAVLDVSDKTLGYVIILKDISKLKQAQKKAAWGEVAQRMAHEIKNPLTPILLSAQRLRNKFLDTLKGKELEIIDKTTSVIIDQVESMEAMVSDFADYANTPRIERKLLDLNALIRQSIALYDAQGDLSIEFDLANDVPTLLLDPKNISRVLINLIKNSVESARKDCDLIVNITTQYLPTEGIVRLNIKDNGQGFDKHIIKQIFEPYVTTKVKGSGLGMAIVHNIIEQHDGRIFVSNIKPHGAMISIEFDKKPTAGA